MAERQIGSLSIQFVASTPSASRRGQFPFMASRCSRQRRTLMAFETKRMLTRVAHRTVFTSTRPNSNSMILLLQVV